MADYESPGAAFSNTIEDALMRRQQQQRQAMLDQLAVREQAVREKQAADVSRWHDEETTIQKGKLAEDIREKRQKEVRDRAASMLPGDVPSPEMVKQASDVGLADELMPKPPEALPGIAAVPQGQTRFGLVAPGDPQAPRTVLGTAPQRTAQKIKDDLQAARDKVFATGGDLNTPETRRALAEYESIPGAPKISPELLKQPKTDTTETVIRQNPRTGVVEQYQPDGTWTKLAGNPPKGAHWITEPPPNTDAANQRKENRVQSARQFYLGKMTDRAKTVNTQLDALDAMDTALTAAQGGNHQAEGLAVIELMKATVAGAGVRLTQPEIDMEMAKARTTWQSLQLTANKWTGKGPLQITAEQAEGLRNLHKKLLEKAEAAHDRLVKGQRDIVNADTIEKVNEAGVDAEENRHPKAETPAPGPQKPAYTGSPADIYKNLFTPGAK